MDVSRRHPHPKTAFKLKAMAEKTMTETILLSGNEAIARGAWEAGVRVASGYPGTPSTEILENLSSYEGVYTEWAPNEKVSLEVVLGASFAGARAMATMKHVGLNVAADPLFTAAYTGVRGGLVIIEADDPTMHSSQNEQDNRNYAYAAKVPMLEPSDANEAKAFTRLAFGLSEEMDIPVILRTTTRLSHVKGMVETEAPEESPVERGIVKSPEKLVMLPANARKRRVDLKKRLAKLVEFSESFENNRIEWGDRKRGFITSGVPYLYVKEAFPEASALKLGMIHPLPEKLIREFAAGVDEIIVVEELDPFIELRVKAMGIPCRGKDLIPEIGELNTEIVRSAVTGVPTGKGASPLEIPLRPPNMCAGCPHRGLFYVLNKLKVFVAGDIGCYTLGFLPPLSAMDTCVCMGASIGTAFGMEKALGKDALGKVVAVLGDSTFIHSGITGLIDVVYNKGFTTVIILDNRITGMTGHQPNPATGKTIRDEDTVEIDLKALCKAIGVKHVKKVNPHDIPATMKVLKREINRPEPSVVIAQFPCVLIPEERARKKALYQVITEKCTGCRSCLKLGCPAIEWVKLTDAERQRLGLKEKQKGYSHIDPMVCNGCAQCIKVCKFGAIEEMERAP